MRGGVEGDVRRRVGGEVELERHKPERTIRVDRFIILTMT